MSVAIWLEGCAPPASSQSLGTLTWPKAALALVLGPKPVGFKVFALIPRGFEPPFARSPVFLAPSTLAPW